ncbi:hypothetical protein [Tsuneonella sp. SYSU-LHT278]|uniref:hypothetical protein n=1 Tax=Tsuneonella sediminis TaxID=3416089 RepID=UPI003F79F25B
MTAILLALLFAVVAITSALTLADCAVRGRNAFRHVRRELARSDAVRMITVTMDGADGARMPALRPVTLSAGRPSQRRTARVSAPLRVAA